MSNPFTQGMTKLQLPEGMGSMLSVGGYCLNADKDRCVEVPAQFVKDLEAQGLTRFNSNTLSLKK